METINKKMTLGEILNKSPSSAIVMMKYGLHSIGCHVVSWESLENGAKAHGLSSKQIDNMVDEINALIKKSKKPKKSKE